MHADYYYLCNLNYAPRAHLRMGALRPHYYCHDVIFIGTHIK